MKVFSTIYCAAVGLVVLSTSCTQTDFSEETEIESAAEVSAISVGINKPKSAATLLENDDNPIISVKEFVDGDNLYISQLGPSVEPQFSDFSEQGYPYCYIYQYYENPEADWDNQYNFKLPENTERLPIDWNTVKNVGSVGNAFVFYGFFFPSQEPTWQVQANQQGTDDPFDTSNLLNSDILGAYHSTSALQTRLRFRLFHLMVYLKVRLYVPVYQSNAGQGNSFGYSGFEAGSLQTAYVMNASTQFNIEWRVNRSSDTEAPATYSVGNKSNIIMYQHPGDNSSITLTNITDFYPSYSGENNEDEVMVYDFSVLFPAQVFNDDFLCFQLTDFEGNTRYYYFAGTQIVGTSGQYNLTQGTLQQLYLYLPRTSNETILVGAEILPWSNSVTDMTVTQDNAESSD